MSRLTRRIKREAGRLKRIRHDLAGRQRALKALNLEISRLKRERAKAKNPSPLRKNIRHELKHKRAVRREVLKIRNRHKHKANVVARRLRHDRAVYKRNRAGRRVPVHGLVWFDGKQISAWIAPILHAARAAGVVFVVISGYRTPAYSESLCYRICGRPSCSGTCAGRNTNHARIEWPGGAVDVLGAWALEQWLQRHPSRLKGYHLPRDRPHFSGTGY
jgi:hypothetical protein